MGTIPNRIECYAKNKNMAFSCEELVGNEATEIMPQQSQCRRLGDDPCWLVDGKLPM